MQLYTGSEVLWMMGRSARGLLSRKCGSCARSSVTPRLKYKIKNNNVSVTHSLITTQPPERVALLVHLKLLIMQPVMFNSRHISASKDTLHSHVILRSSPRGKKSQACSLKKMGRIKKKKKKERDNTPAHNRGGGVSSSSSYLTLRR